MADDQEKTEEASDKKIEDARKEGNVPKSQDVSGLFALFVAILAFLALFPFIGQHMMATFVYLFGVMNEPFGREMLSGVVYNLAREFLLMVMPLALAVAIAGVLGNLAQFGFLFTTKPLVPDFKKIDPIKGLANLFSLKKVIEGFKITLKAFVTMGVAFIFFWMFIKELPTIALFEYKAQLEWLASKALIIALVMLLITFVFALADLVIVRQQYFKKLRMSKQEVKDEMKQMEGDPLIKQKIRQIQMQMSRKRMMSAVPNADVVITNPTHYAVALEYKPKKHKAPIVVAKGMNNIALKIKEIARENGVHITQNPPLARALYKGVDLEREIPEELYNAVAEVLAFVHKVENR
ncbi:MAG: flagellar biosynthesis protein FlhB [Sulfuricurvum sp. PC08-66]|nr:MAG: flagellar biosynthesis protein FlhB [Sulfuricurvum sp. PC08-66]